MVQTFFSLTKGNRRCKDHLKEKGRKKMQGQADEKDFLLIIFPWFFHSSLKQKTKREKLKFIILSLSLSRHTLRTISERP